MEAMEEEEVYVPKKKPQILASLAAIIGAFALGTVLGWSSPVFPNMDTIPLQLSNDEKSWIAAVALLGAAIGSPFAGLCVEWFGRKFTILLVSLPFCFGWLMISLSADRLLIFVGRFVTGFCGGTMALAIPIYINEVSQGSIGARLSDGVPLAITGGILFSFAFGAFIGWSWLSTLCALFPLLVGVLMFCMPETPRYLLSKGKLCEASRKLSWLRGAGLSLNVDPELRETKQKIEAVRTSGGCCGGFCTWSSIKCLLICLVLMILQQFSGIYAILFYAVYIFRDTEITLDVNNATIALGCVYILATMLSTGALARTGRKRLVIISELVMALSLGALGAYFYVTPDIQYYMSPVPILSLMAYISAFAIGLGPVPFIIMREMFPLNAIGFASAIAFTLSWGLAFLVTLYFDKLKQEVGNAWCYWTFAIICAAGAAFILCIVPETKGKNPEDIRKGIGKRGADTSAKLAGHLKSNIPLPSKWGFGKGTAPEGDKSPDVDVEKGPEEEPPKKKKFPFSPFKKTKKDEDAPAEEKKAENDVENPPVAEEKKDKKFPFSVFSRKDKKEKDAETDGEGATTDAEKAPEDHEKKKKDKKKKKKDKKKGKKGKKGTEDPEAEEDKDSKEKEKQEDDPADKEAAASGSADANKSQDAKNTDQDEEDPDSGTLV